MRVTCLAGTRPEAIKLAPVIRTLRANHSPFCVRVINSGQHGAEVSDIFGELDVVVDEHLEITSGLSLPAMTSALQGGLSRTRSLTEADLVIVQGDTTTAFAGALAAFHARVPIAHVEAGLRSHSLDSPFPEEAHRLLIAQLATIHFAPTQIAKRNLRAEGIDAARIAVTGNTVVDALVRVLVLPHTPASFAADGRIVLVTLHRRETWGAALERICAAIRSAIVAHSDVRVVFPVHMNPQVAATVRRCLGTDSRFDLLTPLGYRAFISLLQRAHLVVTDSGGVQEEAATLGKRVLLLRPVTDRPESMEEGLARLVGTHGSDVHELVDAELRSPVLTNPSGVYGDGRAAARIVTALERWRRELTPLLPLAQEFAANRKPANELGETELM